ncbi:MAG: hypothetical protein J3K34DRAFT_169664 [Monoraphidium minutum]|nr:MAG: hypothetical protein J3K34DRAFT_169664 [Monoraphidium minutum]
MPRAVVSPRAAGDARSGAGAPARRRPSAWRPPPCGRRQRKGRARWPMLWAPPLDAGAPAAASAPRPVAWRGRRRRAPSQCKPRGLCRRSSRRNWSGRGVRGRRRAPELSAASPPAATLRPLQPPPAAGSADGFGGLDTMRHQAAAAFAGREGKEGMGGERGTTGKRPLVA